MHLFLLAGSPSPDLALAVCTAGACRIFLELNRPGLILPGAFGLLLVLLGAAWLSLHPLSGYALLTILIAAGVLASNLFRAMPGWMLTASTLGLVLGFRFLLTSSAGASPIHIATALGCGGLLGALAAFLSRVAFRARRAKAVH